MDICVSVAVRRVAGGARALRSSAPGHARSASCPKQGTVRRNRERGDECRELQREQTLREDGRPSRKTFQHLG